jgi:hypothetical protein
MDIFMKTLRVLGISIQHNIHNLKNSQNSTSAVAQVNVHNVPYAHKVPNQHIIYFTCSGWHARPVRSRLYQIRLHHVFDSSPKVLGPAWQVWTSCFIGTWFWWISVNCGLAPQCGIWRRVSDFLQMPCTPHTESCELLFHPFLLEAALDACSGLLSDSSRAFCAFRQRVAD